MDEPQDEGLLALIATGDAAAFRQLIARHRARVVAIAWRMMGNEADGEDIAQEAFARVWVNAAKWKTAEAGGTAKFSTWLTRVVMNLCIDRKRRKQPQALDALVEAGHEFADGAEGAEDGMVRGQVSAAVAAAIAALPPRQKQAIVLCVYEEMGNIEAARIMGLSVGAIESLLVRARRSLKETLSDLRQG